MKIVNKVVIVGGGSAAWLTAAHLITNTDIKITLVDKEISTPVGVGEATLLGFRHFMNECAITIDEWFPAIDATFKKGINYPDWLTKGDDIWHPFGVSTTFQGHTLNNLWADNQEYSYKNYAIPSYNTSVIHNKFESDLEVTAFHIDAGKLVSFLQQKLFDKITLIRSEVLDINRNEQGIQSIVLKNGNIIEGDIFVDCTGFNSVLNPHRKTESLAKSIFTDTAIAYPVKYMDKHNEMHPYTKAHAVEHGWTWTTPIRTRIGSGLVFNRSVTSIETAKDFFVNYWGEDRVDRDKIRVIDWTPYYNPNPWYENTVNIGLSAGFIEPLESTGLAITTTQIKMLTGFIRNRIWSEIDSTTYNILFRNRFVESADFVSFHYAKAEERKGPFWQYVKETFTHSDKQLAMLEMAKEGMLENSYTKDEDTFISGNWNVWIAQLGFPIGPSRTNIPKSVSQHLLLKYQKSNEEYGFNNARHHATEIERLEYFYGLRPLI
jgi:tryptophan halogenase